MPGKERPPHQVIPVYPWMQIPECPSVMTKKARVIVPVINQRCRLVGIFSETEADLCKIFQEFFVTRDPGIRPASLVPSIPGKLSRLSKTTCDMGIHQHPLGRSPGDRCEISINVENGCPQSLIKNIESSIEKTVQIRESTPV